MEGNTLSMPPTRGTSRLFHLFLHICHRFASLRPCSTICYSGTSHVLCCFRDLARAAQDGLSHLLTCLAPTPTSQTRRALQSLPPPEMWGSPSAEREAPHRPSARSLVFVL